MIFKQKHSSYWYSKTIGQAKIAGGIIENILMKIPLQLDKVAIVLGRKSFGSASIFVAFLCWCFEYHNGLQVKTILPKF
jgi:hypothetical protein